MKLKTNKKKAIILLSGGIDSTVCLALAKSQGFDCYALTIDYGQRHRIEIQAAKAVVSALGVVEHRVVSLGIGDFGGSALTDTQLAVPHQSSAGIPITYVPARNTVFLAAALAYVEVVGAEAIFFGANKDDWQHYPDCRPEYFKAFENLARLATGVGVNGKAIQLITPLIQDDKAAIIQKGRELGVNFALTFSCYDPDPQGQPCLQCNACRLRERAMVANDRSV